MKEKKGQKRREDEYRYIKWRERRCVCVCCPFPISPVFCSNGEEEYNSLSFTASSLHFFSYSIATRTTITQHLSPTFSLLNTTISHFQFSPFYFWVLSYPPNTPTTLTLSHLSNPPSILSSQRLYTICVSNFPPILELSTDKDQNFLIFRFWVLCLSWLMVLTFTGMQELCVKLNSF